MVGPGVRADQQGRHRAADDSPCRRRRQPPAVAAPGGDRDGQPQGGHQQHRREGERPGVAGVQQPGQHAAYRLVPGVLGVADPPGPEDDIRPEPPRVVREQHAGEQRRPQKSARGYRRLPQRGVPLPTPVRLGESAQREEEREHRRSELDTGGDADAHPHPPMPGPAGEVPQDEHGQQQVDLPVPQRRPHRLAPHGRRCQQQCGRRPRYRQRAADQPQGEMHQRDEQHQVGEGGQRPHLGYVEVGERGEEQRGEGRVGRRQAGDRRPHPVEVVSAADGPPLGPVDHEVDHRHVRRPLGEPERGERGQTGDGGGSGWPAQHSVCGGPGMCGVLQRAHSGRRYRPRPLRPGTIWRGTVRAVYSGRRCGRDHREAGL